MMLLVRERYSEHNGEPPLFPSRPWRNAERNAQREEETVRSFIISAIISKCLSGSLSCFRVYRSLADVSALYCSTSWINSIEFSRNVSSWLNPMDLAHSFPRTINFVRILFILEPCNLLQSRSTLYKMLYIKRFIAMAEYNEGVRIYVEIQESTLQRNIIQDKLFYKISSRILLERRKFLTFVKL